MESQKKKRRLLRRVEMMANDEINKKADEYISYFEKHKEDIPNIDKLIKLLKSDNKTGHIVHAEFVKRFFELSFIHHKNYF